MYFSVICLDSVEKKNCDVFIFSQTISYVLCVFQFFIAVGHLLRRVTKNKIRKEKNEKLKENVLEH